MAIFTCATCGAEFWRVFIDGDPVCDTCKFDALHPRPEGFSYQRYDIGFTAGQEILRSSKPSADALAIIDRMPERFIHRLYPRGVEVYAYATESVDGKPYLSPGRNPLFDELKEAK